MVRGEWDVKLLAFSEIAEAYVKFHMTLMILGNLSNALLMSN